jgi:hypothetical protein
MKVNIYLGVYGPESLGDWSVGLVVTRSGSEDVILKKKIGEHTPMMSSFASGHVPIPSMPENSSIDRFARATPSPLHPHRSQRLLEVIHEAGEAARASGRPGLYLSARLGVRGCVSTRLSRIAAA